MLRLFLLRAEGLVQESLEEVVGLAERFPACLSHARPNSKDGSKRLLFCKRWLEQQELFELAFGDHLLHRLGGSSLHEGFGDNHQSVKKKWIHVSAGSDRIDLLVESNSTVSEHNVSDRGKAPRDTGHQE